MASTFLGHRLIPMLVLLAACGSNNAGSTAGSSSGGASAMQMTGSGGTTHSAGSGAGGSAAQSGSSLGGTTSLGGAVGLGGSAAGQVGSNTSGGGSGGASCALGTASSITEVMKGNVADGSQVRLMSVVATSPKFLLSKGNAGACLWAVFVSEPVAQAAEYTGAIVVTTGARAPVSSSGVAGDCPKGTDPIPEDLKLGDSLNVSGNVISYVRSDCASSTTPPPSPELRITACDVQRDGTTKSVPMPAAVSNPADLTNTADAAAHRKWTGVLVTLSNLKAVDVTGTGPVGSTGTIRYTNGVRTRDRIYQPTTAAFGLSTTFSKVVGLLHLDVCQWSIEPRSPCTDFVPKSTTCP